MILKGRRDRTEREMRDRRTERAWALCWLLMPYTSSDAEPITPDQLIGERGDKLVFPALNQKPKRGKLVTLLNEEEARAKGKALFEAYSKQFAGKV